MAASNGEVLARWISEAGREHPHYLHRGGTIFVNREGSLYYDPTGAGRQNGRRSEVLAEFVGERFHKQGFALLNGDGFEMTDATAWQTRVRGAAHAEFTWQRCPIIPFAALNGASVDRSTIKIIEVTQETNETERHEVKVDFTSAFVNPQVMPGLGFHRTDDYDYDENHPNQTWEGRYENIRLMVVLRRGTSTPHAWTIQRLFMWAQPEFGQPGWQQMSPSSNHERKKGGGYYYPWTWMEQIHRLGATVFIASYQGHKGRHRFVSAFDMQEPGGLYFLAQLPDKGDCENYSQALNLLAPPIVHHAREQGKQVHRQGDVFAIEIDRDDAWVYEDAEFRVRREVVMEDLDQRLRMGLKPTLPTAEEVREQRTCPFCTGKHQFGNGPKARRALMIHGTGHTADEVVVKKDGRTFVRGVMHHDPVLETPGREPEHRDMVLINSGGKRDGWFLAIRNTVPRQRPQTVVTEPANETQQGRAAGNNNTAYEAARQAERVREGVAAA